MIKCTDSSVTETEPQCQFFVVRKKRLCRMTVRPGRQYCGEHEPEPKLENGQADTRIPCPNDPKHTCYASKLEKHLAICNARAVPQPAYIVPGVNAPAAAIRARRLLSEVPAHLLLGLVQKVNLLYDKYVKDQISIAAEHPIHPLVASEYAEENRTDSSRRHLRQASSLLWLAEDEGLVQDNTCYVELGAGKGQLSYYAWRAWCAQPARGSGVLLLDRASLRHKRDNKLRGREQQPSDCVSPGPQGAEPRGPQGAEPRGPQGAEPRGPQGAEPRTPQGAEPRGPQGAEPRGPQGAEPRGPQGAEPRGPQGAEPRGPQGAEPRGPQGAEPRGPTRLRADLAHVALGAAPGVPAARHVVGLAKHLCGVATDYALRCVTSEQLGAKTRGLVLATCCHHRCQREALCGSQLLSEMGITESEMDIMFGIVSWATCGDGRSRGDRARDQHAVEAQQEDAGGTQQQSAAVLCAAGRHAAGRRAKALLDWARARWLRRRGLRARLVRFVPAAVSPENLAIVAVRDT